MRSILIKELNSFFSSLVGYVALLVFLSMCGLFLWVLPNTSIIEYGLAGLNKFFDLAPWMLFLLVPAITMRSFADEYKAGTIEWLFTKPITDLDIILGKYFATLVLILFALLPTVVYVYSVSTLALAGNVPDYGAIIGSYIGLFFLAATFAAVGIYCSSLSSNQVVSFLIALIACFMLYTGFEQLSRLFESLGGVDYYLSMTGMQFHYNSISRGLIDTRDVVYFVSVIALFIILTRYRLNNRTKEIAKTY
ncbi:MAG: gliding motility-associated ABC transporter permease subunit GldF [Chitinophagia bacterium]|nr:gliding motility-associated ABC transporter permease subunit GldF [Chitinophagia bacterium]